MNKFTIINIRFWHVIFYIVTVLISIFALVLIGMEILPVWLTMLIYTLAGICFGCSIVLIIRDSGKVMNWIKEHFAKGSLPYRMAADYHFRTFVCITFGIIIGSAYILINMYYGIKDHFIWYLAISVYYIVLSLMRFFILLQEKNLASTDYNFVIKRRKERKTYCFTGCMIILTAAVMFWILESIADFDANHATGIFIYFVGIYTFYKMIMAILNLRIATRQESYHVKAIRNIGFVDALMSMLHLQIVLIARYGNLQGADYTNLNMRLGSVICIISLAVGISMIVRKRMDDKVKIQL